MLKLGRRAGRLSHSTDTPHRKLAVRLYSPRRHAPTGPAHRVLTDLPHPRETPIVGRDREFGALDRLSRALARGESGSLVLHGEAGIGKTTILERFIARQ